jgi:hypothetical protein
MVVQHSQALRSQAVNVWCLDLTSITADVGESLSSKNVSAVEDSGLRKGTCQIICKDEEKVRSLGPRFRRNAHGLIKLDGQGCLSFRLRVLAKLHQSRDGASALFNSVVPVPRMYAVPRNERKTTQQVGGIDFELSFPRHKIFPAFHV